MNGSAPSLVLDLVTTADTQAYLDEKKIDMSPACLTHVMAITGGVAWLVSRALSLHEAQGCRDGHHVELDRALEDSVLHRLDTISGEARDWVELTCCVDGAPTGAASLSGTPVEDLVREAFAEALLLRNGHAVPIVRTAVLRSLPPHRIVDLGAAALPPADGQDPVGPTSRGAQLSDVLLVDAGETLSTDPARADDLYRAAAMAGATGQQVWLHRAMAAWDSGDLDGASAATDALFTSGDANIPHEAVGIAVSTWAARGFLQTGSSFFVTGSEPTTAKRMVKASIARIGSGMAPEADSAGGRASPPPGGMPQPSSTLDVAARMLDDGLVASLAVERSQSALTNLVRASDLYNAVATTEAMPELPAVIAATVALGAGESLTAQRVIDAAVAAGQCGRWAQRRLLLWQALVAIQGENLPGARAALAKAESIPGSISPRDEFLRLAMRVTLTRRYEDLHALEKVWETARETVRFVDVDLYLLLPLTTLVTASARLGDAETLEAQFSQGVSLLRGLGSPPLWASAVDWAGVQRGILLNQPKTVGPHAQALVAASSHSPVVKKMSKAGAVWLEVLRGMVDADRVDEAVRSLASIGLAWDGARLAAHGAGRTTDRRVAARLLTLARQFHPPAENVSSSKAQPGQRTAVAAGSSANLSEREMQVARMVVAGKTYAEIGESIFISPRTVEHHVAHIRRRLSVGSRSELISRLREIVRDDLVAAEPEPSSPIP